MKKNSNQYPAPIGTTNGGDGFIDAANLAQRLGVPKSWVEEQVRSRAKDPIPHLKFGKYTRFAWGSHELAQWLRRRMVISNGTVERAGIKENS